MNRPHVVIIGGGFSGTAVAIHLARLTTEPLHITVVEPRATLGGGVAYSTFEAAHRINVPAARMQLSGDEKGDFDRWYRQQQAFRQDPDALRPDGAVYPQRSQFGHYLAEKFAQAAQLRADVQLHHHRSEAVSWNEDEVVTADGAHLKADITILAVSHPPPALPRQLLSLADHPALIANPWSPGALDQIPTDASVAIIGTGLSMADVVASLSLRGHHGPLLAFSRRGQLSRDNLSGEWPEWTLPPLPANATARQWLRHIRNEVQRAHAQQLPWQRVLDEVRAQGQTIWQGFSLTEQRRFQRHLRSWWNVYRYRIAPQLSQVIGQRQQQGTLTVLAARAQAIEASGEQLTLRLKTRKGDSQSHQLDYLIVTTGPAHADLTDSQPLLSQLRQQGLIKPDALHLGIAVDAHSHVLNAEDGAEARILISGPAARGRFGELMGLPQVADHAVAVAQETLSTLQTLTHRRCPVTTS